MAQITINEGLAWLKTLKRRHEELLALRNDNAHRERRSYGASADKEIVKEPVYHVKVLDRLVTRVAREIRLLEHLLIELAEVILDHAQFLECELQKPTVNRMQCPPGAEGVTQLVRGGSQARRREGREDGGNPFRHPPAPAASGGH